VQRVTRRTALSLVAAIACAGLAALVWWLAFHVGIGHRADAALFQRLERWEGTSSYNFAEGVAGLCNTLPYALLAALVVAMALGTRGLRGALVAGAVLVVPNAVTQLLKGVTSANRDLVASAATHIGEASWPSGHATAAMALGLCAILVAPAGWRAATAVVGLGIGFGVGLAVIMVGWHLPSDVAGGYFIAAAAACVGAAALGPAEAARVVFSRPAATAALPDRSPRARG
jgi:membrane-associated phospholipid phosphatase